MKKCMCSVILAYCKLGIFLCPFWSFSEFSEMKSVFLFFNLIVVSGFINISTTTFVLLIWQIVYGVRIYNFPAHSAFTTLCYSSNVSFVCIISLTADEMVSLFVRLPWTKESSLVLDEARSYLRTMQLSLL